MSYNSEYGAKGESSPDDEVGEILEKYVYLLYSYHKISQINDFLHKDSNDLAFTNNNFLLCKTLCNL